MRLGAKHAPRYTPRATSTATPTPTAVIQKSEKARKGIKMSENV